MELSGCRTSAMRSVEVCAGEGCPHSLHALCVADSFFWLPQIEEHESTKGAIAAVNI
jgi:hypothetical protein